MKPILNIRPFWLELANQCFHHLNAPEGPTRCTGRFEQLVCLRLELRVIQVPKTQSLYRVSLGWIDVRVLSVAN
jgi:hypothetical protein